MAENNEHGSNIEKLIAVQKQILEKLEKLEEIKEVLENGE